MTVPAESSYLRDVNSMIWEVDRSALGTFNFKKPRGIREDDLERITKIFKEYVSKIAPESHRTAVGELERRFSLELCLTLNDFLTKTLFWKFYKFKPVGEVLEYKNQLSNGFKIESDYKELFDKINYSLSELFKSKKIGHEWTLRVYRIFANSITLKDNGFFDEIPLAIDANAILEKAREILRSPVEFSERITPRFLDTLAAAQLTLKQFAPEAFDEEPNLALPFNPIEFERGSNEYRALTCSAFLESIININDFSYLDVSGSDTSGD